MINKPIEDSALFGANDMPDWRLLKDFLDREGPISKPQIMRLLMSTLQMFQAEANLVQIEEPICVVGDIHGQYADLLNMIS
jgi:serine/threonine-protein phosphatase 2B catalytic subunit